MNQETKYKNYITHANTKFAKYWVDVEDEDILKILERFNNLFTEVYVNSKCHRTFFERFNESLCDKKVSKENWFSEETFFVQYEFYYKLDQEMREKGILRASRKLYEVLVSFYRYITRKENIEEYSAKFSGLFIEAISSKSFYKYYKEGYQFVYYSPLADVPKGDKICILPNEVLTMNSDHANDTRKGFDVSMCPEVYRDELKHFLWDNIQQISSLLFYKKLIDFLIFIDEKARENVSYINDNKVFNESILWEYRIKILKESNKRSTCKSIFKILRKYLRYYQDKYNITENEINVFSLANLEEYKGGQVIENDDLQLIYSEFVNKAKANPKYRIYCLMIEIFISTRFRFGEILNFQRDKLISYGNEEYGIEYIGKTTGGFVETKISNETAGLLYEAIKITEDVAKIGGRSSKYIFIEPYCGVKVQTKCKRIAFDVEFHKVLNELEEKLINKHYKVNNIRHTYIDNVYKEGIKQGLKIHEIALVVDNSYKTANKYYRRRNELINYLEVTNGIYISNVDIMGNVLKEEDGEYHNIVKEGLGSCATSKCTFEIGECLRCNNFITFTNRKERFEEAVKQIDELIEHEENMDYIEELQANKKLLLRYIVEMESLLMKEEE